MSKRPIFKSKRPMFESKQRMFNCRAYVRIVGLVKIEALGKGHAGIRFDCLKIFREKF